MFDFVCNPPDDGDQAFAAALAKYHDHVVVGANIDTGSNQIVDAPNGILIPPPPMDDPRVGLVHYWPDPVDGKVRGCVPTSPGDNSPGKASFGRRSSIV